MFVDSLYHLKLYCFNENELQDETSMSNSIAKILVQLSSLNLKPQMDRFDILSVYSDSLRDMITYLLDTDLKDSLDIILWHPMVFSRRNQEFDSGIFNKIKENKIEDTDFQTKLENLNNREIALQIRESKLIEIERDLIKRENKIALLEKAAKEKLLQADIRLKELIIKSITKKEKLNVKTWIIHRQLIIVILKFSRSLSERRIKFKGHSPLKAIQNIPISHPKPKLEGENKNRVDFEKVNIRTDCNKTDSKDKIRRTSKKRFSFVDIFTRKNTNKTIETKHAISLKDLVDEEFNVDSFKPIAWTEENKRQAFNLLRIMNSESSSVDEDCVIKHTKMAVILLAEYANASGFIAPDKLFFRNQNLTSVPLDLIAADEDVEAVTKALFSHNNFNVLTTSDLKRLAQFPNLKYIFFEHNSIASIEGCSFSQVPKIKYLELSHNNLKEISNEVYDDLVKLKSLSFINLKRNPIQNYKNIDKLVAKGVQIDYDGVLGREKKIRMRSRSVVSDGTVNDDENLDDSNNDDELQLKQEEEQDNQYQENVDESEEDEEKNSTRHHDKPVKAFVVDHKTDQNPNVGTHKISNNFLGSIIFNFLAAFLVLVALPIAMVIYYFMHRRDAIS
ncbi:nischarin related [Holotrichia oblita]|uniref:Nischarin related n=1 Tax=Holotrichia oblita TaxID=644536 RepID=A0ACB9TSN2_HOLOL|nr:nischarin related [Holotrichia oblita]